MYIPKSFLIEDLPTLHDLMEAHNFATLISMVNGEPFATHIPYMVDRQRGPFGTLIAHVARANPHWKTLDETVTTLNIFQGPHAYISPAWYETHESVPTWNYAVVHAYGKPRLIHDTEALRAMVSTLVDVHESHFETPWEVVNAEPYMENQLKAIVGLEIEIERIEGKFKFNQNRSVTDQQGVIRAMESQNTADSQAVAQIMRNNLD